MTQTSYFVAIDLGTSRIAAATARVAADGSIISAPFPLGRKSDSVATVVYVSDDGELSFGDAAERRGVTQPERLIREFKRSIGDEVPLAVGGRSLRAETLYAETVAEIVRLITEREGSAPDGLALTHPTVWGGHRLELIRSALSSLGLADVELMTEPEAAARHYEAARPLQMGETLAVYDLGGGTFDSVLLRKEIDGSFDIVGEPIGIEDLGGADFDDAVMRHVIAASGIDVTALDQGDPDTRLALSQLRRECVDAKEALSFDSEATIPVLLPPHRTSVRLTRSEFEAMITPSVDRTIDAVDDALESADLEPPQLEAILLIGGSSRIPRVAQRLSERFDRPIAVDADPKAAIALGAARTALIRAQDRELTGMPGSALAVIEEEPASALVLAGEEVPFTPAPVGAASVARKSSPFLLAGAAVAIAASIVFASTISAGSRSADPSPVSSSPTPTSSPSSAPAPNEAAALPAAEPVADVEPLSKTQPSGPPNPRRTATQKATEQSKSASPTTNATTPSSSTAQSPSSTQNSPSTPTTTQPGGAATPAPSTAPVPEPTTAPEPEPEPTVIPDPEPTTPPADPEPTTPPADPEPTAPPADPEPTTPPADPEPTTPPADPAPDPSPSPTDPV